MREICGRFLRRGLGDGKCLRRGWNVGAKKYSFSVICHPRPKGLARLSETPLALAVLFAGSQISQAINVVTKAEVVRSIGVCSGCRLPCYLSSIVGPSPEA